MIKKGIINQLIQTHNLKSIEQHLIYSYLTNNEILFDKSPILTSYFKDFEQNLQLNFDTSSLGISNIKELENILELIIPVSDRKLNGAFFTPDYIIDYIIKEIQPQEDETNLDPSCGCGAFLVGLTDYYKYKFNKPIRKIIKENIFGSDILEYNIHRTKIILAIYALQNGEQLTESDFNLYHQDSLRTKWKMSFDNILGNPPYVKFQDLSDDNRDYLAKRWTTVEGGSFNLYFAFFELGYKLLKSTGKLGYITPNNYFTSLSGESIRKYFQQQKCVTRIIDFSHKKVFDAQTYTAITFLNKQQNEAIFYDRIKEGYSPEMFLTNANGSPNYLKELNFKKWRLLKTDEQQNIKAIETIGKPIGKLFDICVGIATLKDEIFFIDGNHMKNGFYLKTTENGAFEIEYEIVRPVHKIPDFKTQEEVEQNTRKIICPYDMKNGIATAIPEIVFKRKFPKCYEYFLSEKENLLARDKGKVNYEPFYVWGRTQGLSRIGKKILNPTFSQHPRFLIVEEVDAFFTNGYGLYFREPDISGLFSEFINPITKLENIDVVQKILNSYIMDYYVSKTSVSIQGGYPCYQKNFIEKFTIPELTEREIETIRSLNDSQVIDNFLIEKYQLNEFSGNLS
jgi:methylase of polypeptide subunit release factors